MVRVRPVELTERARLAPRADDRHAADRLLEEPVDPRDALADLAIVTMRAAAEEVDRERHRPEEEQAHDRHLPVDQHMNAVMPTSFSRSSTIVIAPAANISFNTSTSVVTRETSLPTGVRSKKLIGSRSR
jgi:hypothetical protein